MMNLVGGINVNEVGKYLYVKVNIVYLRACVHPCVRARGGFMGIVSGGEPVFMVVLLTISRFVLSWVVTRCFSSLTRQFLNELKSPLINTLSILFPGRDFFYACREQVLPPSWTRAVFVLNFGSFDLDFAFHILLDNRKKIVHLLF